MVVAVKSEALHQRITGRGDASPYSSKDRGHHQAWPATAQQEETMLIIIVVVVVVMTHQLSSTF